MDPCLLQWRLYNHNIRNENLWSIKYNVYADQHRHVIKKTTELNYIYYDCRGATVGDRRSMPWMSPYIAVPNLLSMISMIPTQTTVHVYTVVYRPSGEPNMYWPHIWWLNQAVERGVDCDER
jgi:hypothetical protein